MIHTYSPFGFLENLERYTCNSDLGGEQYVFSFENDYGASVIKNPYSYGGPQGYYELAVLYHGHLTYDTPITDDVIGWLTIEGVKELLQQIKDLKVEVEK